MTDPNGQFARATFARTNKKLTISDGMTSVTANYFSGGTYTTFDSNGNPTTTSFLSVPAGEYDILEGPNSNGFYRLEPRDGVYGDDEGPGGRTAFRLHHPGGSEGCVTAVGWEDWNPVDALLKATSTDTVKVRNRNWLPRCDKEVKRYGVLTVLRE